MKQKKISQANLQHKLNQKIIQSKAVIQDSTKNIKI